MAFLAHDRLAVTPALGPEHGKLLANLLRQQTFTVKKWTITCQQVTDIEGHFVMSHVRLALGLRTWVQTWLQWCMLCWLDFCILLLLRPIARRGLRQRG